MAIARPARRVEYDARTTMHYGLAVGLAAAGPGNPDELKFVYEPGLAAVPSMATVLGFDDSWIEAAGLDLRKIVHGAQRLQLLAPLPAAGALNVNFSIVGVADRGAGRGAVIVQETRLDDAATGKPLVIGQSSLFVRGEGGGGSAGIEPKPHALPARAPDRVLLAQTAPNQALYFRLLGDFNPLHASPEAAQASGFPQPILHGACTYGIACAAILRGLCGFDPARLKEFEARFVGPVFPGEALAFLLWQEGEAVSFRAVAAERGATVLDNGRAVVAAAIGN